MNQKDTCDVCEEIINIKALISFLKTLDDKVKAINHDSLINIIQESIITINLTFEIHKNINKYIKIICEKLGSKIAHPNIIHILCESCAQDFTDFVIDCRECQPWYFIFMKGHDPICSDNAIKRVRKFNKAEITNIIDMIEDERAAEACNEYGIYFPDLYDFNQEDTTRIACDIFMSPIEYYTYN